MNLPPLSLYIHFPWCIRKCPYCDFNSHQLSTPIPEEDYINVLAKELILYEAQLTERTLISIFMGGGTPSLFSGPALAKLMKIIEQRCKLAPQCEITLEANPGTAEQARFKHYYESGINRLSLGVQSFQTKFLQRLGRIHDATEACRAIEIAQTAGFTNFNLDLMHGLPDQTWQEAHYDITTALSFQPTHLSWYQLTLEPDTPFYHRPPQLPTEDILDTIYEQGHNYIIQNNYHHYEVSAYSQPLKQCVHNQNYWLFGDYLGIGAGAHSKLTHAGYIERFVNIKYPRQYLNYVDSPVESKRILTPEEIPVEFMLNILRLQDQLVSYELFTERTDLSPAVINNTLTKLATEGYLTHNDQGFKLTTLGHRFLNNVLENFL